MKYLIAFAIRYERSSKIYGQYNLSTTAPRRRGGEAGSAGGIYSANTAAVNSVEALKAMSQDFAMLHQRKDKHSHQSRL